MLMASAHVPSERETPEHETLAEYIDEHREGLEDVADADLKASPLIEVLLAKRDRGDIQ